MTDITPDPELSRDRCGSSFLFFDDRTFESMIAH